MFTKTEIAAINKGFSALQFAADVNWAYGPRVREAFRAECRHMAKLDQGRTYAKALIVREFLRGFDNPEIRLIDAAGRLSCLDMVLLGAEIATHECHRGTVRPDDIDAMREARLAYRREQVRR